MPTAASPASAPNRWAVLALLGVAQLMVVLDSTIVNIALPSAQQDLGFSTENRQWVVTAYALAFGSLLLVGGQARRPLRAQVDLHRRPDRLLGRVVPRRARAVLRRPGRRTRAPGAFGALLAPSALSLLTVTFADSPERPKAFGIFAAVATAGASVGLLLGGFLTDALSWRWCLYVNLLIAIPAALVALRLHRQRGAAAPAAHRLRRRRARLPRAVRDRLRLLRGRDRLLAVAGDDRLARGGRRAAHRLRLRRAARREPAAAAAHRAGTARAAAPTPSISIAGASVFAVFLFLTFFMQQNLGYSPMKTGVAFLPMTALIFIVAPTLQTRVLPRVGVRPIIMTGMALGAVAMLGFFAQLTPTSTYVAHVLPGLLIIGIGMPCIFAPSFATATLGVDRYEAGVASAMVNTCQQVGGAVGTAVLSTIFATPPPATPPATRAVRGWPPPPRCTATRPRSTSRRSCSCRPARRCARAAAQHPARSSSRSREPAADMA